MATDTVELSAEAALAEIGRVERIQGALERRTAGLTWMIWGIAGAAIFVTYSFVGVVVDAYAPEAAYLFPFLWAPWTVMAVLATVLLWRSVGLVIEVDDEAGRREGIASMIVFLGLIFGSLFAMNALDAPLVEPAVVLLALGAATAVMGVVGRRVHGDVLHQRVSLVGGALLATIAIATSLLVGGDGDAAYAWFSLVAPASIAVVNFGIGLLLVSKG